MSNNHKPRTMIEGEFLRLIRDRHWEYADRVNASGAVVIAAITDDQKIVLVEQFRIPLQCNTIELPAGLVGDEPGGADEHYEIAAKRELHEETGYEAENMTFLLESPSSAGLATETFNLLLATGLKKTGNGGGVDHEEITIHEIPIDSVYDWLMQRSAQGVAIDAKIFAGLYFAQQMHRALM